MAQFALSELLQVAPVRTAKRSRKSTWPLKSFWRAKDKPNHAARSTSGNAHSFPDFGGHSSSNVLLRMLSRQLVLYDSRGGSDFASYTLTVVP
jgi:hypothetical protein